LAKAPCHRLGEEDFTEGNVMMFRSVALAALGLVLMQAPWASAQTKVDRRQFDQVTGKAIQFLQTKGQAEDGSFSSETGPAITAMVATALMKHGRGPEDPMVSKALAYISTFAKPDGGVYSPGSTHRNYETSLAMMCFAEANADGRYDKLLKKAEAFVKDLQWELDESADVDNPAFGGAGYGSHKRPDLSNTSFMVEALNSVGVGPEDEAMKRALVFISRCQNLETANNTTPFAAKNPDGGFYYTPAAGGTSQAGATDQGGLRSYGSMTYAGLKSMIFAGVSADDERVKAAVKWLQSNYSLEQNPGMGSSGLYYYYHTFAKALDALEQDQFVDAAGKKHNWRQELLNTLASKQQADGSWVNETERWLEGDANLVTGYALLALAYCKP